MRKAAVASNNRFCIDVTPDGILTKFNLCNSPSAGFEGRVSSRIPHAPVTGHSIFVCAHAARDIRCGVAGPPVAEAFQATLEARGLSAQATVRRTSHVGGHKYAGNVLIYPGGDWYGYVTPADIPRIVDRHILGGETVWDLWRGRLGLTSEEQLQLMNSGLTL